MLEHHPPIAGKGLVRSIARQGHCHFLARQLAHPIGRQRRSISKRLVAMKGYQISQTKIIGGNYPRAMIGRKSPGDHIGITCFVEGLVVKADRTAVDLCIARLRHQRDDCAAIDPAREECAQRHVRHHPAAHGRPQ
jgi:hypothetical protein